MTDEFGSSEAGKKGGRARAERLTQEQRREIARQAATARWAKKAIAKATHEGVLRLGDGTELPCYVLEDQTRVLARIQFIQAIGRKGKPKGGRKYDDEFNLPVFLTATNLKPFIPDDLLENSAPIPFLTPNGVLAIGYKAEFLPEVCGVFMDAETAGALAKNQIHIATKCKILLKAFSQLGIIALVDEATGFQDDRDRRALAIILEKFIAKELRRWVKTFPLEYYKQLCRLKGVPFSADMKLPQFFGHLTNDIVYRRLAPGVLRALRRKNPVVENGRRKHKHFQHLTEDIGHPKLLQHLGSVVTLMTIAEDWTQFQTTLDRIHPQQKELPLFDQLDGED
jgi:hypothetical protein